MDKLLAISCYFDNIASNLLPEEIKRDVRQILQKLVFITFLSHFVFIDRQRINE